ncbi:MAG: hypothetical protein ACI8UD_000205 [Planctomycetota bacterium]|jgi:hypothetical protein
MTQGGATIRGPGTGTAGSSIEVEISGNADTLQVAFGGPDGTKTFDVPPGGKVTIPIPPGFDGSFSITMGSGLNRQGITVEVPSPTP